MIKDFFDITEFVYDKDRSTLTYKGEFPWPNPNEQQEKIIIIGKLSNIQFHYKEMAISQDEKTQRYEQKWIYIPSDPSPIDSISKLSLIFKNNSKYY